MKRWTQIFRAMANANRLKIIKLLSDGALEQTVGEIARGIHVTFRGTSQHLRLLHGLDIVNSNGRNGHVYYSLNRNLPADLKKVIDIFLH